MKYPDRRIARMIQALIDDGATRTQAEEVVARRIEAEISAAAKASVGPDDPPFDPGALTLPGEVLVEGDVGETMDVLHAHDDPDLRALLGDNA